MRDPFTRGGLSLVPAAALLLFTGRGEAQGAGAQADRSEGQVERQAAPAKNVNVGGEVTYTIRQAVSLDGEPGEEVGVSQIGASTSARIQVGPRTLVTPGISFQGQYLSREGDAMSGAGTELYTLEVPIMLVHVLDQKWSLGGRVSAGLSGDFASLDRHLGVGAAAMAIYRSSDRLSLGFGAGLGYQSGRWLPFPVATINWRPSDRFMVDALLPQYSRAIYRLGDRWEAGLMVQFEGARWALDGDEGEATTIDYFSVDTGGVVGVRVTGNAWLNLFAGWNAFRRYEVHGGPGDGAHDPEPGLVVRGGLEVRLPGS